MSKGKNWHKWTPADDELIRTGNESHRPLLEIAKEIGCTYKALTARKHQLGIERNYIDKNIKSRESYQRRQRLFMAQSAYYKIKYKNGLGILHDVSGRFPTLGQAKRFAERMQDFRTGDISQIDRKDRVVLKRWEYNNGQWVEV